MANIYSRVELFYQKTPEAESIVPQEKVEQYFRRRAWHAASNQDMELEWRLISLLIEYVDRGGFYSFDSLMPMDYQEILHRVQERWQDMPQGEDLRERAFDALRDFYRVVLPEADAALYDKLESARKACRENRVLSPQLESGRPSLFEGKAEMTEADVDELNAHLDAILRYVQTFYQRIEFRDEINRAVYLFCGPAGNLDAVIGSEEEDAFWEAFWDYFLFDYHMIVDDDTPLHYFYREEHDSLDEVDQRVIEDLMRSRFTIFYISSVGEDCVICHDLFTDDEMELPLPEISMADYDKVLLYGHVHARDTMLLNHISSVAATGKLRQRIKEEILRQYEIYRWRCPKASIGEFFVRESAAARHVIHLMTSFAQLRVVPMLRPRRKATPPGRMELPKSYASAQARLARYALRFDMSFEERGIIAGLYRDFVRGTSKLTLALKTRGDTLAAVLMVFLIVNAIPFQEERLIRVFRTTPERVRVRLGDVFSALDCILFDPRYLSERGFVNALFLRPDSRKKE